MVLDRSDIFVPFLQLVLPLHRSCRMLNACADVALAECRLPIADSRLFVNAQPGANIIDPRLLVGFPMVYHKFLLETQ